MKDDKVSPIQNLLELYSRVERGEQLRDQLVQLAIALAICEGLWRIPTHAHTEKP